MDTEDKQSHKSKPSWFVFLGIIVGLGALAAYYVWPQLRLKTPTDVIIVKAVEGPIKVKPHDPGGTNVAHQNLLVIDMLKSGVTDTDEVETLRLKESSPEPPPIDVSKLASSANQKFSQRDNTSTTIQQVAGEVSNAVLPPVKLETANKAKALLRPESANKSLHVKQPDGPAFVIQLAAFRSAEKSEEIANLLSEKHSSRLENMRLQTMRLNTATNGVFFRVVSPPLPRSEAEAVCKKLRRAGQDCFLRKLSVSDE